MTKEPETAGQSVDVDALYLDERPGLVRLAFLLTGSSETAEDVVQDAFERCLSRLDRVDKPGAYLRTAVVNGARSKMRRERSAPVLPAPMAAELGESALELWAALRTLSERRRTAIVLRYWVDLPVTEIADAMDCRPGTVSSLLHRGLADLRKELADD
jgi:RNA polymerase sigma factor (sigma-70 family)